MHEKCHMKILCNCWRKKAHQFLASCIISKKNKVFLKNFNLTHHNIVLIIRIVSILQAIEFVTNVKLATTKNFVLLILVTSLFALIFQYWLLHMNCNRFELSILDNLHHSFFVHYATALPYPGSSGFKEYGIK